MRVQDELQGEKDNVQTLPGGGVGFLGLEPQLKGPKHYRFNVMLRYEMTYCIRAE